MKIITYSLRNYEQNSEQYYKDVNVALYLADRIAVMNNGAIVQVGTPEEIFKKPNSIFVANFIGMKDSFKNRIDNSKADHYYADASFAK